ncbi:MAG TPA: acetate/propionate family kinase [Acidimicrobiales bacterium]|nr:acetate/propionate family kinase [Acidimicrobiales bacterium]
MQRAIGALAPVDAVGHRIVHGGTEFTRAVILNEEVEQRLRALTDLAPLHQPKSLAALEATRATLPDVPAVACFDTAFHANLPAAASTYALPLEWRRRWPLRRFGFHGLSHAYSSRRGAAMLGRPIEDLRVVTCHLGAGASLCAVLRGQSVDTTMGFTPLEGLVMATRSGSVDPGLVLWLEQHAGVSTAELAEVLESRSGLLGLAGQADMEAILRKRARGDASARLAVAVYLHHLCAGIAAMAAAMEGLDALVFTGGVGENSDSIREMCGERLGFLGVQIDPGCNQRSAGDRQIGAPTSSVQVMVIQSREDLQIAHEVRRLLNE